ncbi:MAG: transcriptional activator NhaR [Pseudomonadota bacterium]
MRHLNYNHLYYFWTVACEGSIARASEALHLTPQTISGQLKLLDDAVGSPLFQRQGRGLALTDTGRLVKQYADEIFTAGAELSQVVRGHRPQSHSTLTVGIVASIPKLIAYRVLETSFSLETPMRVVCREAELDALLAELAVHQLDLIISDRPIPIGFGVKAYNHQLGQSGIGIFAARAVAARYSKKFPQSLEGAPLILPLHNTALRRELDQWLEQLNVGPQIVAECEDSALTKMLGSSGVGLFPAPLAIRDEIERTYKARLVGELGGVSESYVAISPERRLKHPAVLDIIERARSQLFV